ncbi:hypothetical protein BGW41_008210 [Actinomortierella wolfii]|nr:hypothetical protein BGW41_008210 [Actinomortierella wolfii]
MASEQEQKALAGGVAVTKKQKKEQLEALAALQAQLDVSVSLARNQVRSWMNLDDYPSDDEDTKSVAASEMKARQPGLGLGAKYISHKEAMRHVPLNAFESKLKRQLTGGKVAADQQRQDNALPDKYQEHKMMLAAKRREQQEKEEEEEDSRTRTISKSAPVVSTANTSASSTTPPPAKPSNGAAETSDASTNGASVEAGTKKQGNRKMPAIHPALLKGNPPPGSQDALQQSHSASPKSVPKVASIGGGSGKKKRTGDFFSMYMNERAERMAKKQKKAQAKRDDSDDD